MDDQTYTWDANGNLLSDGTRTFTYDAANRLAKVVSGTITTTFTYNGDGHRVRKVADGVTTTYVVALLGLPHVLAETTGGSSTAYLYGHDLLAEEDTAWAWHLNDGLGSVRQLTDGGGDVTLGQGYTPFGVLLWREGSGASGFGYTGEQEDSDIKLVFLRARYYDPYLGRFISKDPWPGTPLKPGTLNGYVYVLNNPLLYVDPSGLQEGYGPGYGGRRGLPEGRYLITPYGWFDKQHFHTGDPKDIIDQVENAVESGGDYVIIEQPVMSLPVIGPVGFFEATYWASGRVCGDDAIGVALGIYYDWSIRFEIWEGTLTIHIPILDIWLGGRETSFAVEDLPSHYIGFFSAATGLSLDVILYDIMGGSIVSTAELGYPEVEPPRTTELWSESELKNILFLPKVQDKTGHWVHVPWPEALTLTPIGSDSGLWHYVSSEGDIWPFRR